MKSQPARLPYLFVPAMALVGVFFTMGTSCKKEPPASEKQAQSSGPTDEQVRSVAAATIGSFKKELVGTLTANVAKGIEQGIHTCASTAPEIAQKHSANGIVVGRSSSKLRSEKNAPKPWVKTAMEQLAKEPKPGAFRVVKLDGDRFGYAEPLLIQPVCTNCHGKSISEEAKTAIAKHYPNDQATGYDIGDFRGVVWAELPRASFASK